MGQGSLRFLRDGSGEPRGGQGRVKGASGWSGTGRGILGKVRVGSGEPRGGPGLVGGASGRSETGRGSIGEVRDGSRSLEDVRNGLGEPA